VTEEGLGARVEVHHKHHARQVEARVVKEGAVLPKREGIGGIVERLEVVGGQHDEALSDVFGQLGTPRGINGCFEHKI
jgi:hypothetical protein